MAAQTRSGYSVCRSAIPPTRRSKDSAFAPVGETTAAAHQGQRRRSCGHERHQLLVVVAQWFHYRWVMRFCAYQYQHRPLSVLVERWRLAEAMGFDVLWNVDTVNEPDQPRTPMFEGSTTLAAMALLTSSIRIGTLVTSLYFRNPVIAAKAAMTVDQLSGGRVEVALGAGDPSAQPEAAGVLACAPREQVARFREFAGLVERLLRCETTTFEGRYYRCTDAEMIPGSV